MADTCIKEEEDAQNSISKIDSEMPLENTDDFAAQVLGQFPILRVIFNFLSAKQLQTITQVCKLWREAGLPLLKKRGCWCTRLILLNEPGKEDLKDGEGEKRLEKIFENRFRSELDSSYHIPKTLVVFRKFKKPSQTLPKNIQVVGCDVSFVVGKDQRLLNEPAKEFHYIINANHGPSEVQYSCSYLSFPDLYDSCIKTFHWDGVKMKGIFNGSIDVKELMDIPSSSKQAVVLFFVKTGASRMSAIVRNIRSVHKDVTMNFAGGICEGLIHGDIKPLKSNGLSGLLLHGNNINSFISVLEEDTIQDLHECISQLNQNIQTQLGRPPDPKCSVIFMFPCVGRGPFMYNQNNVECDKLQEFFPGVPVLGFFGQGEIACSSDSPLSHSVDYSYSTVFCFVEIKPYF